MEIRVYQLEDILKQKEGTCIVGYDATCVALDYVKKQDVCHKYLGNMYEVDE